MTLFRVFNPFKYTDNKITKQELITYEIHIYKDDAKIFINFCKFTEDASLQLDNSNLIDVDLFYQTYLFNTTKKYFAIEKAYIIIQQYIKLYNDYTKACVLYKDAKINLSFIRNKFNNAIHIFNQTKIFTNKNNYIAKQVYDISQQLQKTVMVTNEYEKILLHKKTIITVYALSERCNNKITYNIDNSFTRYVS